MWIDKTRRGIPFFTDFYAAELLWDKTSPLNNEIVGEVFKHTQNKLIRDVAHCIIGELKYLERFCGCDWSEFFSGPSPIAFLDNHAKVFRSRQMIYRKNGGNSFFKDASNCFIYEGWPPNYGGPAWGEICCKAYSLANYKGNMGGLAVAIDMVIDSCHNNGRCLDKLYVNINEFLTRKTKENIHEELIRNSQRSIRMLRSITIK